MNVNGLQITHVKSHLQKYRLSLTSRAAAVDNAAARSTWQLMTWSNNVTTTVKKETQEASGNDHTSQTTASDEDAPEVMNTASGLIPRLPEAPLADFGHTHLFKNRAAAGSNAETRQSPPNGVHAASTLPGIAEGLGRPNDGGRDFAQDSNNDALELLATLVAAEEARTAAPASIKPVPMPMPIRSQRYPAQSLSSMSHFKHNGVSTTRSRPVVMGNGPGPAALEDAIRVLPSGGPAGAQYRRYPPTEGVMTQQPPAYDGAPPAHGADDVLNSIDLVVRLIGEQVTAQRQLISASESLARQLSRFRAGYGSARGMRSLTPPLMPPGVEASGTMQRTNPTIAALQVLVQGAADNQNERGMKEVTNNVINE
jgi:hypothetical protein